MSLLTRLGVVADIIAAGAALKKHREITRMGNKTSSKKMAYQTKRQKEYLLAYAKTDLFETQHKREKDALERLQLPEASWTLPELQASGKKFTYEFNGRTEKKSPDNSFLVGYGALHNLISCYSSLAVLAQCIAGYLLVESGDCNASTPKLFYSYDDALDRIAEQYGLTENNVSVILSRARKKLRLKLAKEGYL